MKKTLIFFFAFPVSSGKLRPFGRGETILVFPESSENENYEMLCERRKEGKKDMKDRDKVRS